MNQNEVLSKVVDDFKAAMDDTIGCILLSDEYFFGFERKDRSLVYPLFTNEVNLAKQLDQNTLFVLLGKYIRILFAYNRFSHIAYLIDVFNCSEIVDEPVKRQIQKIKYRSILFKGRYYDLNKKDECSDFFYSSSCPATDDFGIVELERPKVLVLGTFCPNATEYVQMLRDNPYLLQNKLDKKEPLLEIERLLMISQILSTQGLNPVSAKTNNRHITNLFLRVKSLSDVVDQIIMVFNDAGGVCIEFGQICENQTLAKKTTVFVPKSLLENEPRRLTAYATHGAFQLEYPEIRWFSTDEDLMEQVVGEFNKPHIIQKTNLG